MGRGKKLTDSEMKTIMTLSKENVSISKIAKVIHRSRKVVMNYLKNPEKYGNTKRPGRPAALSAREKRAILRAASNAPMTTRQIAEAAGVQTNVRNVQRVLQRSKHLQRRKLKKNRL